MSVVCWNVPAKEGSKRCSLRARWLKGSGEDTKGGQRQVGPGKTKVGIVRAEAQQGALPATPGGPPLLLPGM